MLVELIIVIIECISPYIVPSLVAPMYVINWTKMAVSGIKSTKIRCPKISVKCYFRIKHVPVI
jgi:hypothetical protein